MTPDESRAIRRHLHSAEGAHLLCRRKACRRARCCRLIETCASRLYAGALPEGEELMALRLAYLIELGALWQRLPRPVPRHAKRGPKAPFQKSSDGEKAQALSERSTRSAIRADLPRRSRR
jgi:hypothetical protein